MNSILHFEAADIRNKISMAIATGLMKEAFVQLSEKQANVPLRTAIEAEKGMAFFMPSYSPKWKLYGLKMVSVFPENKLPLLAVQGKMLVMSGENGRPLALLDAAAVTALRTGAASGLATDLLARKDASTLALFGTGAQAWTQAEGVLSVRKIVQIMVKGTSRKEEESFCERLSENLTADARPMESLSALKKADVICTATTSHQPLFTMDALQQGTHINAVGSFKPEMREIGFDVINACQLFVDQREAVLAEAGEVAIPIAEGLLTPDCIVAEMGEIVAQKKMGRTSPSQITLFKSVGNAIQDLAIANYLVGINR